VPALALAVGEPADRQQVRSIEQADAVDQFKPNTGVQFVCDFREAGAA
jgi:hypothetical protein